MSFSEVADRVWVARYEWFDANVTLVRGDRGLLVVDTHASAVAARQVIDDVRALGIGEVVEIVNTHEHFDHTFGNGEFRAAYGPDVPIHAHEEAAARTASAAERIKAVYADNPDEPRGDEVLATTVVPAETTFSSAVALDLGDRFVELVHPGRGHTCGDLVVRVPDADVLLAGDLVEESGPREHTPGFGADCFPMEWPLTLDIVLGLTSSSATSSRSSATTSGSSPRPSVTWPGEACRSTRPCPRPTPGRSRWPTSARPSGAPTSTCRAARSDCPSSEPSEPLPQEPLIWPGEPAATPRGVGSRA